MKLDLPLVGRGAELAQLHAALEGSGGLVLVSGEAGIGKSRILREMATTLEEQGSMVFWGRPEQVTRPGAFALMLDLLDDFSSRSSLPEMSEGVAQLEAHLLDPGGDSSIGGALARRVAIEVRSLISLSGARPAIFLEDVHAADDASLAVLFHLVRTAADDGQRFVVTYRLEEAAGSEALGRFLEQATRDRSTSEIELAPLDLDASKELASRMLNLGPDSEDVLRIAAMAEGVPFYVEELGLSTDEGGVPSTIARSVTNRLNRLNERGRDVMRMASLMPGVIDSQVLSRGCEIPPSEVARALTDAASAGLLIDREGRLVFRHALLRDTIISSLVSAQVEEMSERLALATEYVYSDDLVRHAKVLATYWYGARNTEAAKRFALMAAERALALAATQEARESLELALSCGPGDVPEALAGLAEVEIREGGGSEAESLLERAASSFARSGDLDRAASTLGRSAWLSIVDRRIEDAMATIDRALLLIDNVDEIPARAGLLARKGDLFIQSGEVIKGKLLLGESLKLAEEAGDHVVEAECLDLLSDVAHGKDDIAEYVRLTKAACAQALESGRAETIGRAHNNAALASNTYGRLDESIDLLATARAALQEGFGAGGLAIIDVTEAMTRWRLGQPGEVYRIVGRRELVWTRWRGAARMLASWSSLHFGDNARRQDAIDKAWREIGVDRRVVDLDDMDVGIEAQDALLCELLGQEDVPENGLVAARKHFGLTRGQLLDDRLMGEWLLGRAQAAVGDDDGFASTLREMENSLSVASSPYFAAKFEELRGQQDQGSGALNSALGRFESAASSFAEMGNFSDRVSCMTRLGDALSLCGDKGGAIAVLQEALLLATACGSRLLARRVESALRGLGKRPRAGRPKKSQEENNRLSAREEEVVAHVAMGLTNAEIGARLFLSDRTVQDHITHALRKLGLQGRAALASWAVRNLAL